MKLLSDVGVDGTAGVAVEERRLNVNISRKLPDRLELGLLAILLVTKKPL
jgi:hypothetical protein